MHWDNKLSPPYRLFQSFYFPVEPLRQSFHELEFPVLLLVHTSTSTKLEHSLSCLFLPETKCWASLYYFYGHFNLKDPGVLLFKRSHAFSFFVPNHALPFSLSARIPSGFNGIAEIRNMEDYCPASNTAPHMSERNVLWPLEIFPFPDSRSWQTTAESGPLISNML